MNRTKMAFLYIWLLCFWLFIFINGIYGLNKYNNTSLMIILFLSTFIFMIFKVKVAGLVSMGISYYGTYLVLDRYFDYPISLTLLTFILSISPLIFIDSKYDLLFSGKRKINYKKLVRKLIKRGDSRRSIYNNLENQFENKKELVNIINNEHIRLKTINEMSGRHSVYGSFFAWVFLISSLLMPVAYLAIFIIFSEGIITEEKMMSNLTILISIIFAIVMSFSLVSFILIRIYSTVSILMLKLKIN